MNNPSNPFGYEQPKLRVGFLMAFLLIAMALDVVLLGANASAAYMIQMAIDGSPVSQGTADIVQIGAALAALVRVGAGITGFVLLLVTLHQFNQNAQHISQAELDHSPGWTVGWFFIPFANLVKPYTAVKEIWERSGASALPVVGIWWCLWIISNILNRISFRWNMELNDNSPLQDYMQVAQFDVVVGLVDVLYGIVILSLVWMLYRTQTEKAQGTFGPDQSIYAPQPNNPYAAQPYAAPPPPTNEPRRPF